MGLHNRASFRIKPGMKKLGQSHMRGGLLYFLALGVVAITSLFIFAPELFAAEKAAKVDYREVPLIGSRNLIWIVAQLHLLAGGFVLGVPVFAWICHIIGVMGKEQRYINLAKEFTNLIVAAFEMTAILGSLLLLFLIALYPKLVNYFSEFFWPTYYFYVFLFAASMVILYLYWSGFEKLKDRQGLHLFYGFLLNLVALLVMATPNSWATFQASPVVLPEDAGAIERAWAAANNMTWMPVNIHRFVANIVLGGFLVGAYAGVRYLGAKTDEEREHYDWMGYIGNFIGMFGLLTLPFAGYWLAREIYIYSQQMGITLMGGFLSWLFIIQAVLIGVLFLGANYYFWLGLSYRTEGGAQSYMKPMMGMLVVILMCFMIWLTPHSLVASLEEARAMGGAHHPVLGVLGVMSAKMTAVNVMILVSFISFLIYWRAGQQPTVKWAKVANYLIIFLFAVAFIALVVLGVWGYFVPAIVRINKFSVWQVLIVLFVLIVVTPVVAKMLKGAKETSTMIWGRMPVRSQHVLVINAITIVFTMSMMGYARSASRVHWHVYGVLEDTTKHAFSPALGEALTIAAVCTFLYFVLVGLVVWTTFNTTRKPAFSTQYFFFTPLYHYIVSLVEKPAEPAGEASTQSKQMWKVLGTSLALLLAYIYMSYSVPQLESHPPKKEKFDLSLINSKADLVQQGKKLFFSKGKCSLCHTIEPSHGARAPILGGIGGRLKKEFIIDSLLHPKNYIYKDYTGNVTRPFPAEMPVINKPPIGLSMQELLMVVSFVQSLGGEVTVEVEEVKALSQETEAEEVKPGITPAAVSVPDEVKKPEIPAIVAPVDSDEAKKPLTPPDVVEEVSGAATANPDEVKKELIPPDVVEEVSGAVTANPDEVKKELIPPIVEENISDAN